MRSSLARGLCERENWRNARGELCLASARSALPGLASALDLTPPAPRHPRPRVLDAGTVGPVGDGEDKRLSRSMMATWHPEGEARSPGARMRCRITSSHHGRLCGQLAPEGARPAVAAEKVDGIVAEVMASERKH